MGPVYVSLRPGDQLTVESNWFGAGEDRDEKNLKSTRVLSHPHRYLPESCPGEYR